MKGFLMSLEVAEKFYKLCAEKQANTLPERIKIMNELLHEENIRIVKEQQIKDLLKDKTVLVVETPKKKGRKTQ